MQHDAIPDLESLSRDAVRLLLAKYHIALSVDDALTLQRDILRRPPTRAECILWSVQGSEHCSYKSTRNALGTLPTDAPNVILGPREDAGIVAVATDNAGHRYGVVMSHESHNHPAQLVPCEGAATGVGGNMRDVSCMGAEVIAVADGLRFGAISRPQTRRIAEGVVKGIGGYGNAAGIPNIAGDVYFDAAYNDNCLVTVVTLGIVREDRIIHSHAPKDAKDHCFILVGKATDNSGFGGASFASASLDDEAGMSGKGAVQEPNAFLKRQLLKANNALFDILARQGDIPRTGFKDLGAGGVACASVELADSAGYGAEIRLEAVPVAMHGLDPAVILCSETQERFMWVVPPDLVDLVLHHYNHDFALPRLSDGAGAAVIGKIRTDGQYVVSFEGQTLVDARASDVTRGIVQDRPVRPYASSTEEPVLPSCDAESTLLALLAHENIASRAPILEQYDKQVQGRTRCEAGEADAGVLTPFNDAHYPAEIRATGIALALDHNPRYNLVNPWQGAVNAVTEAARNVAATGASPAALTDCLCFGNPENPEHLFAFREAVRGLGDACRAIGLADHPGAPLPIIAGNVSLYNESPRGVIPPSPMVACLGVLPDASRAVTTDLKAVGSLLVLVATGKPALGGSVYYALHGALGADIPKPDLQRIGDEIHGVVEAIQQGLVLAAHDISEGGLAVALAEMSFAREIGVDVMIPEICPVEVALFGEGYGFVLEVADAQWMPLQTLFASRSVPVRVIGKTTGSGRLRMGDIVDIPVTAAKVAFENGLREKLV